MIAYVVTHYKMPPYRLHDFLLWNDQIFNRPETRLVIVIDKPLLSLPDYARAVVFPKPMDRFALSWTSNYGIRAAMSDGADIICKTDPDCIIPQELHRRIATVKDGHAIAPVYHMAATADHVRRGASTIRPWNASRGTIAMRQSGWHAVHGYDERMIGYGPEDGDICDRIQARGIAIDRARGAPIYHIAHDSGVTQHPAKRTDHWGRGGINPENRQEIKAIRRQKNWHNPEWGNF